MKKKQSKIDIFLEWCLCGIVGFAVVAWSLGAAAAFEAQSKLNKMGTVKHWFEKSERIGDKETGKLVSFVEYYVADMGFYED